LLVRLRRPTQVILDSVPRALIPGLLLTPNDSLAFGESLKGALQFVLWKGIQLFDSNDRRIHLLSPGTLLNKIKIDFAATQNDPIHLMGLGDLRIGQHVLETAVG
jgi:hypothetical protein